MYRAALKARKNRQDVSKFASLIETPASGAVVLPASGRFAFKSISGATAGTDVATVVTSVTRQIKSPVMEEGGLLVMDRLHVGSSITLESDFELFLDTGLGNYKKIAGA